MSGVHHCRFRFGQMFIDRNNLMTTASFQRPSAIVPGCSASSETQLLLPAMFQVSVSWVEIPFIGGGIRISNATKFRRADLRGKEIVELDLRRAQTRHIFVNPPRIHEDLNHES
jgi:hypothetical protein